LADETLTASASAAFVRQENSAVTAVCASRSAAPPSADRSTRSERLFSEIGASQTSRADYAGALAASSASIKAPGLDFDNLSCVAQLC
jgi:hypothetical protein